MSTWIRCACDVLDHKWRAWGFGTEQPTKYYLACRRIGCNQQREAYWKDLTIQERADIQEQPGPAAGGLRTSDDLGTC